MKYWAEEYLDSFTYEFLVSRNSRNGNDFIEVCANYTCYHGEGYEVACDSEEADGMICDDDETSLKFQEDFKIPFAGGRYSLNGAVNGVNTVAYFWSSSPKVVGTPSGDGAFTFLLGSDKVQNTYGLPVYGFSVRCFKDSYLSFPTNENGDSGSGSASTHVTLTLTA